MPDNHASFKVFCRGGLNTSRDVLSQGEESPGSATQLINYEPAVTGGYRKINGYSNDYGTVPGEGDVLGVAVVNGINDGILACRKSVADDAYLYYWDNDTDAWVEVTTSGSPTMVGVTKVRFERVNFTTPEVVLVDGVNPAATYDGTTYTQVTDSTAPSAPKYVSAFQNHLFLAEGNKLYFSAPLNTTDFSVANGAGVIQVGFDIVQIKAFRNELYIFGANHIKKLTGTSQADFLVANVTDDLGCIASDSVIEIGGDLLFLSQDGLRPVSGTNKIGDVNLETLSKDIQSIFTAVVFEGDLDSLSTVVVRQKSQFRIFFSVSDAQGVIGGFRQTPQGMGMEFGQLVGISATCADSGYIGQFEYILHGDSLGKVHRQERGNSFDGQDIFSLYQTPFFHMQDPEIRKTFDRVATYLRSEGDNSIVFSVLYDYQDPDTLSPTNYNILTEGAAAYYNEAIYDSSATFDGNPSPVERTNISGSALSIALKYVTNNTDASHSIQGIVITYGQGDRR